MSAAGRAKIGTHTCKARCGRRSADLNGGRICTRELAEDFEKIEVEKMGAGTHERLHAMMDKMVTEFLRKP